MIAARIGRADADSSILGPVDRALGLRLRRGQGTDRRDPALHARATSSTISAIGGTAPRPDWVRDARSSISLLQASRTCDRRFRRQAPGGTSERRRESDDVDAVRRRRTLPASSCSCVSRSSGEKPRRLQPWAPACAGAQREWRPSVTALPRRGGLPPLCDQYVRRALQCHHPAACRLDSRTTCAARRTRRGAIRAAFAGLRQPGDGRCRAGRNDGRDRGARARRCAPARSARLRRR